MALQGTLKDFGFAEILQLLGMQRKTGILTLQDGKEKVEIRFDAGQLVGAETDGKNLDQRLGQVLVRTGKLTETQLDEALRAQKRTLQRLGHILVKRGFVSEADVVEALRVQSLQIIFRLFRWREGTYDVHLLDEVEYDREHFPPIGAETILMEGARMVDEWPIIERRVRSDAAVFERRAPAPGATAPGDAELDFRPAFGAAAAGAAVPQLSREEQAVLSLVDGRSSVAELAERSQLGEFETYRILSELVTRDLLREIDPATAVPPASTAARAADGLVRGLIGLLLAAAALGGLLTLHANPLTPWARGGGAAERLQLHASRARLEHIERALQVCWLDRGVFPATLDELPAGQYLAPEGLLDPWGRAYEYHLSRGGYELSGVDGDGQPAPELTLARRFGAGTRMVLGDDALAE